MKGFSIIFKRLNSGAAAALGSGELKAGARHNGITKTMFSRESTTITYIAKEGKDPITVSFSNLFLRDSSGSSGSVDPSSGQKLFTTGQLLENPVATLPERVSIAENGQGIHIAWGDGDSHLYPLEFLKRYSGQTAEPQTLPHGPILWDQDGFKQNIGQMLSLTFDSYMDSRHNDSLYKTLVNMRKFGISFITDLPKFNASSESLVKKIAERIGPITRTFYGETFDVINRTGAENIAYTNKALPLHQDLLYLDCTPGWQLLHSIKNSGDDGDAGMSYFVDGFHAARYVHDTDTHAYDALTQVPINYHYQRNDNRYYSSRPLIVENEITADSMPISDFTPLLKEINYSPMFQAPFSFGIWEKPKGHELSTPSGKMTQRLLFKDFLRGLQLFEKFIKMPENQFRLKLPENTCVIFDNRRILHARSAFSGERWLQGCYLNNDAVKSRYTYLTEQGHC